MHSFFYKIINYIKKQEQRLHNPNKPGLTIITAANSKYYTHLINLLVSIKTYSATDSVICYDLGLSESEKQEVKLLCSDLRRFEFENYPLYFNININAGEYAWKPVIINQCGKEFGNLILWLDPGDLVLNNLNNLKRVIKYNAIYSPTAQSDIAKWTHTGTLKYLNVKEEILTKRNRNAAVVGLNFNKKYARELAEKWEQNALIKDCIAPHGSNKENHKQDQSVLSILIYQLQEEYNFNLINSYIDISIHNQYSYKK